MMHLYSSPIIWILFSGLVCLIWSARWLLQKQENSIRRYRQSKSTLLVLFLPGLINLTAFYSLAWHMYITFGDWPGIGTEGFPDALLLHDSLAIDLFTICLCFPLVLFAPLWIIFYLIKPIRPWLDKLAAFGLSCVVSTVLTQLAPSGFLNWFWD
jgi:hypothetical protein